MANWSRTTAQKFPLSVQSGKCVSRRSEGYCAVQERAGVMARWQITRQRHVLPLFL